MATVSTTIKGIDICGFMVKDAQGALAFYRDVLGMAPTMIDPEGRGAEFEFADGTTFGIWSMEGMTSGPFFMLAVEDIKSAIAEMRARGLQVSEPEESPVCFMAFTQDPEGNNLIVHQRKK